MDQFYSPYFCGMPAAYQEYLEQIRYLRRQQEVSARRGSALCPWPDDAVLTAKPCGSLGDAMPLLTLTSAK